MFFEDSRGLLQCDALSALHWIDHGFSTRRSAHWLEELPLASAKQVHGDTLLWAEEAGLQGEADALATKTPGIYVAVRTADCFPILIVDPKNHSVAAVHCGWRGAAAHLASKTIQEMARERGSDPHGFVAAIGPGIGPCCFEVGPEVAVRFGGEGRAKVDLAAHLARQMESAGLAPAQIFTAERCTRCETDAFWSYRREGESAGRMWSGIAIPG